MAFRPSNVGGLSIHEDPYNAAGTSYPPAAQGMNGYQATPATYASPVRSGQREREYEAGPAGGAGPAAAQASGVPSDGQYRLRAQ